MDLSLSPCTLLSCSLRFPSSFSVICGSYINIKKKKSNLFLLLLFLLFCIQIGSATFAEFCSLGVSVAWGSGKKKVARKKKQKKKRKPQPEQKDIIRNTTSKKNGKKLFQVTTKLAFKLIWVRSFNQKHKKVFKAFHYMSLLSVQSIEVDSKIILTHFRG